MAISSKLRFEIFKRDGFKCQYCGRKTPDVILELDHIIPKTKKGKDDVQNLITSCFECNRGKAGTPLEQVFVRKDLKEDLCLLAEKELQLKEYNKLLARKRKREKRDINKVNIKVQELSNGTKVLGDPGIRSIRFFLSIFPVEKILEAFELAYNRLSDKSDHPDIGNVFKYTCGILHNWRRRQNAQ